MGLFQCIGFQRKLWLLTIMLCMSMLLTVYVLSLNCCFVVMSPHTGQSMGTEEGKLVHRSKRDHSPEDEIAKWANWMELQHILTKYGKSNGDTVKPSAMGIEGMKRDDVDKTSHHNRHNKLNRVHKDATSLTHAMPPEDIQYQQHNHNKKDYLSSKHNVHRQNNADQSANKKSTSSNRTSDQTTTRKLPQAIIIGVKKGGTRALLEFLRIHPDVRAPGPEPHFFDRNYNMSLDWYRQQMPATLEGQITMEKTPSYFVTKGVPARIFSMSKDTKLIVVVRNPVTRAISDYTQALSKRTDLKSFEEMAFEDNSTGLVDTSWGAIRIGVYAKHLERWFQYFSLGQMHFVHGEKLISDPSTEMEKVQAFLGLKGVITDKHFYFNATKGFPCLKKPEGSGNPHCLGKTKGRSHPQIRPVVLDRLRDFFRPFNQKFYQMVGQDFGWQ